MNIFKQFAYLLCIFIILAVTNCAVVDKKSEEPEKGFDLLSDKEEMKFGHYVDARIQKDFLVLSPEKHPEIYQAIEKMGQSLVKVSDRPNLKYTFKILSTDFVNAFAGPGGYIYLTTGLLEFAETKDEVAGVMAHELGHISARHVVKQYRNVSYAQTLSMPMVWGGKLIGADILGNVSHFSALFFMQGYSREYERQADYLGVKYMHAVNYNPEGMVSFLRRIWDEKEREKKEGVLETFLRSHPETLARIKDIEKHIEEFKGKDPAISKKY